MNNEQEEKLVEDYQNGLTAYSLQEKVLKDAAIIQMKAALIEKFEATSYKDDKDRTEIWRKMQVIKWFDDILTEIVNDGKIAEQELKGFAKLKQVFKR